jgi:phage terminase large subunit GpA-like protein
MGALEFALPFADIDADAARELRPRPLTTVSAWSDKYRILTSKGSGEPGQWRTERTPYLREILDSLSVNSPAQRIVLMFAAQLGKTEVGLNWIGYVMQHAPGPMLTVLPTLEVRKRWVRQRLDPLLTETPVIRALFDARRARDAGNAEDMKDFPGGMLVIGGANSPASLASMPIRYVLCDEVDRFPWEVGQEGDPLGLIDERTKTFPRRKVLLVSTPTVKGASRIEGEYEKSDMRQFHVPCPHCGELQVLRWRHDDGRYGLIHNAATGAVYYACIHCGERIDEHHKPAMLAAGRWIPRHPERAVRGYHLSGLYSPIGLGFTWAELWQKWEEAHGDTANLKRFINTTLGESWEEQGDSIEDLAIIARLEDYPETLPASLRTAGVDVQKDRLEASIVAWGMGEEGWLIDHLILPGDTARPEVWESLHDALTDAGIAFAAIDSGYNTSMVYAFTEKRRWCVAVKGIAGMGRPLIEDEKKRRQRLRNRRKKAAHVEPLGVDQGKALLYARLKLPVPGPAYLHFPRDPAFDDEYFAQLAAEKLVTKIKGTRPFQEWVQTRPRNEALDCLVYALAALRLSGKTPAAPVASSHQPTPTPAPRRPMLPRGINHTPSR